MQAEEFRTIEYWTERLDKTDENLTDLRKKLWNIPCPELSLEERLELRNELTNLSVLIGLLNAHVQSIKQRPKPTLWERLTNK